MLICNCILFDRNKEKRKKNGIGTYEFTLILKEIYVFVYRIN